MVWWRGVVLNVCIVTIGISGVVFTRRISFIYFVVVVLMNMNVISGTCNRNKLHVMSCCVLISDVTVVILIVPFNE